MDERLICYLESVSSTNSFALDNWDKLSDKQVVLANTQTAGRGRFNRSWLSFKPGNIYMSILLKPASKSMTNWSVLGLFFSLCIARVIGDKGVTVQIKWPNDVLVSGQKLAGVLTEQAKGDSPGIVIGAGVNINYTQEELKQLQRPATSLSIIGVTASRDELVEAILKFFWKDYESVLEHGFSFFMTAYEKLLTGKGNPITISQGEQKYTGCFVGVNQQGHAMVDINHEICTFVSGEMTIS